MAEAIVREERTTLQPTMSGFTMDSYLRRANQNMATYVDVFVEYFLGLAQVPTHRRRQVWQTLFQYLYKVFHTCDTGDLDNCKEVLLLKN